MIIEINEMIDYLDDFFKSDKHETVVGGIAGTQIEKYVLESAMNVHNFDKIMVINGCQDYIGLMKTQLPNVVYWGDLFVEQIVDPLIPTDPWKPDILNPAPEPTHKPDSERMSHYDVIIIFNAWLIDGRHLRAISDNFSGKVVHVVDPCEWIMMRSDYNVPVIVDTLEKVSPMIAMARSIFGFESRAIDRKVRGTLTEVNKMSRRSIGKIDDKQYVTADYDLYKEITDKQFKAPFRKNQKFIVKHDIIDINMENGLRKASLTHDSMLVMTNPTPNPYMKLRLYNSKITYNTDITYREGALRPKSAITVTPANIMLINQSRYHRYNHVVLIINDRPISDWEKYVILKNSNNVTIVSNVR